MPSGDRKGPRLQAVPGDQNDPGGFPRTVAAFEVWLGVHGYTASTIESRRRAIVFFVVWLTERNITRPVEVTFSMIERYQRHLFHYRKRNGQPLTLRSQAQRLTPLRAFFKWATRQHVTAVNPAAELELPRTEQRLPKPALTIAEAEAVLGVPDLSTPIGLRDRAMLEVLYSTGMRRAELAGLHLHDIDIERRTVLIRQGKGRKDRMIPIGARALDWIDRYTTTVRLLWAPSPDPGVLFLTVDGTPVSLHRLTTLMKGYVTASGVWRRKVRVTCFVTPPPHSCSRAGLIFGSFNKCLATSTLPRPKFMPKSLSTTYKPSIRQPIPPQQPDRDDNDPMLLVVTVVFLLQLF